MKKWTCCILSAVLIAVSSVFPFGGAKAVKSEYTNENVEKVGLLENILKKSISFFMGIEESNNENSIQVIVDLTDENDEEFSLEIEKIKTKITTEKIPDNIQAQNKLHSKKVLIYHTHTDEAYLKGDQDYIETSTGRTKDTEYSVVNIGEKLKQELDIRGFTTVHDTTDNVKNGFNKAYQTSYETIKQYVGDIDVYIDLHRDAYMGQKNNYIVNGDKEYAYVCFVVAKGENYTEKPRWQENYALAQKLTDKMNELCPGIAKDIIFKNTRFNQHVSDSCLLIEMGNEQNTLLQVRASAEIVAEAMSLIIE